MGIVNLVPKQGNVEIQGIIALKGKVREFDKGNFKGRVCNATLRDDTGDIELSIWGADIDRIDQGDKVKVINGYVSEFKGKKQLSAGKVGKLEVLAKNQDIPSPLTKAPIKKLGPDPESDDVDDEDRLKDKSEDLGDLSAVSTNVSNAPEKTNVGYFEEGVESIDDEEEII